MKAHLKRKRETIRIKWKGNQGTGLGCEGNNIYIVMIM